MHVQVLFDTGASHSFISEDLCQKYKHSLKPELTLKSLYVTNPIGGPANLGMTCKNVCLFKKIIGSLEIFCPRIQRIWHSIRLGLVIKN